MGHTNSTANLALPQFIGTDKPTWLSDVNGAFAAIDTYAGNNDAALAITDAKADTAIGDAASAVTTAGNAATTAGNAAATATAANTVAGNALTVANGINSKVGVLTDLTTTDKSTVVNAINEVNGKDAADIPYDNTGSGLTATDVQAAIDEVAQGGGGGLPAWTQIGQVSDSSDINLPAGLSEIYIKAEDASDNILFSQVIPFIALTVADKQFTQGYDNQGSHTAFCGIYASTSKVHLQQMKLDGVVVVPTITVYGR